MCAERKLIPYAALLEALDMSSVRDLEDLVIDCIYAGLIKAKLDQRARTMEVQNVVMARDVREGDIDAMMERLVGWQAVCDDLVASIDRNVDAAKASRAQEKTEAERIAAEVASVKKSINDQGGPAAVAQSLSSGGGGGGGGGGRGGRGGRGGGDGGGMGDDFGGGYGPGAPGFDDFQPGGGGPGRGGRGGARSRKLGRGGPGGRHK